MPDLPTWFGNLDEAIRYLEALPFPWVGRADLEQALRVGRRRAQQILQPLVSVQLGRNGLAQRDAVVAHLRDLRAGDKSDTETQRKQRLAGILEDLNRAAARPKVLVEAPKGIEQQGLRDLPAEIELGPGRIVIGGFRGPEEAKRLLLSLIFAMGNEPEAFDRAITSAEDSGG